MTIFTAQCKFFFRLLTLAAVVLLFISPSLQTFAQIATGHPKFVGNIINNYVPTSYDTYWNQVTPENSGKWGSVEGTRGVMNWTDLDLAYNHAKLKGYPFKQHTFVWGNQEPGWISSLPAAEQAAEVEEWIALYAQRYPATEFIDVVNEPLHVIPSFVNAIGGSGATGWDWVIWSFQKARQYNPNAKLILNDYGILGNRKNTTDYIKIINLLKERGLIDGIGVQAHGLEYAQLSSIKTSLDNLAATGVPIYVSELDLEHEDDNTQLGMYKNIFPLLYEHPGVVGVTLWGYLAGQTWKPNTYLLGAVNSLASFTMTTAFQDYTVSGSGTLQVHLTNDAANNSHDLEIDYVVIDGVTYQAEDQAVNTGVWQNSSCGGSFSQWLNCDGYIEFPAAAQSITVRARGVIGTENMEVKVVNDTKERLALQWLRYEYFGVSTGGGDGGGGGTSSVIAEAEGGVLGGTTVGTARAGFSGTGYATGFDVAQDYVEVTVNLAEAGSFPLVIHYAADNAINRTIAVNGSVIQKKFSFPASTTFTDVQFTTTFKAGNNTVKIYMERGDTAGGDIDYVKISGATSGSSLRMATNVDTPEAAAQTDLAIYPNPSADGTFILKLPDGTSKVNILDTSGRLLKVVPVQAQQSMEVKLNVSPGVYIIQAEDGTTIINKRLIVR